MKARSSPIGLLLGPRANREPSLGSSYQTKTARTCYILPVIWTTSWVSLRMILNTSSTSRPYCSSSKITIWLCTMTIASLGCPLWNFSVIKSLLPMSVLKSSWEMLWWTSHHQGAFAEQTINNSTSLQLCFFSRNNIIASKWYDEEKSCLIRKGGLIAYSRRAVLSECSYFIHTIFVWFFGTTLLKFV